ncbi:MAG: DUF3307 domain-containing protein [Neomegalonema sp.]|nr:DUF3307 domain-containing protein [Neomegalonema sp.]
MISADLLLILMALLFVKHLFAEGPLQSCYQVENKGTFMHLGGLYHVGTHMALSAAMLLIWWLATGVALSPSFVIGLLAFEFWIHYAIDYGKSWVDRRYKWTTRIRQEDNTTAVVINDTFYFTIFLLDQMLHSLTYVAMIYAVSMFARAAG